MHKVGSLEFSYDSELSDKANADPAPQGNVQVRVVPQGCCARKTLWSRLFFAVILVLNALIIGASVARYEVKFLLAATTMGLAVNGSAQWVSKYFDDKIQKYLTRFTYLMVIVQIGLVFVPVMLLGKLSSSEDQPTNCICNCTSPSYP